MPAFVHSHRRVRAGAASRASSAGSHPKFSVRAAVTDSRAYDSHLPLPASQSRFLHTHFLHCTDVADHFVDTVMRPKAEVAEGPWGKVEIKGLVRLARVAAWPWSARRTGEIAAAAAAAAAAPCIRPLRAYQRFMGRIFTMCSLLFKLSKSWNCCF